MASVRDVVAALDSFAPFSKAAGWDVVGLMLGDPAGSAERIGLCHDVTDQVVHDAADLDVLVAYHSLLFRPVTRLVPGPGPAGLAYRLLDQGTALVIVHTALDAAPGGAADALASSLGIEETASFGAMEGADTLKLVTFVPEDEADALLDALAEAGAGTIGRYRRCAFGVKGSGTFESDPSANPAVGAPGERTSVDEIRLEVEVNEKDLGTVRSALLSAHPYEEPAYDVYARRGSAGMLGRIGRVTPTTASGLAATVRDTVGGAVRLADGGRRVERVAVIPGSGGDFISDAIRLGADAVVTGDVSHHRARTAVASGVTVVDPGHAATERPGVRWLYASLSAAWDGPVADLTTIDADPWRTDW